MNFFKQLLKGIFLLILSYTQHFPEMKSAIKARQQSNVAKCQASTSGSSDAFDLVGFGPYKSMTRFDLYHSAQDEHKRYIKSILECNVTHPGGQLDMLKQFIMKNSAQEKQEDDMLLIAANQVGQSIPSPAQESNIVEKVR